MSAIAVCALTAAFECLVGHFVAGDSWSVFLQNSDLVAGSVWAFVHLTMLVAPQVFEYYLRCKCSDLR